MCVEAENVASLLFQNKMHRVLLLEVIKAIKPGDQLLWDYGDRFWRNVVEGAVPKRWVNGAG